MNLVTGHERQKQTMEQQAEEKIVWGFNSQHGGL